MTVHAPLLAVLLAMGAPLTAQEAATADPQPQVQTDLQATDAQTEAIVAAADAFLGTLDEMGRSAVLFDRADEAQRANWSNFPTGIFQRAGLRWGDMDAAQREALTALLGTVLSEDGLRMVQEQMAADELLKEQEGGGGGLLTRIGGALGMGGPGGLVFGSDEYFVSFVGEPSTTEPWTLQFGGHHLGLNATVVGSGVTLAPSLTGGQPVRFTLDGQVVDIVVDEATAADALLASLDDAQRAKAVRSTERADLVLGPGKDGMTLQPEGVMGSELSGDQRALLLGLIEARLGILNADDFAVIMPSIEANLDATSLAWFGPDDATSAYWRVVGPTLVLEFSPQEMGGDPSNHLHNMYRDPTNDYGAAWTGGR